MRFLLIITLFLALSCKGTEPRQEAALNDSEIIETATFSVEGMTCSGCENAIQTNVSNLKGIKAIKASYINKHAIVEYNPEITDTLTIKQTIIESGYSVNDIQLQNK